MEGTFFGTLPLESKWQKCVAEASKLLACIFLSSQFKNNTIVHFYEFFSFNLNNESNKDFNFDPAKIQLTSCTKRYESGDFACIEG